MATGHHQPHDRPFYPALQRRLGAELMDVICLLHGVIGMQLPKEIEVLTEHKEARQYYLFEFLLDFDDVTQELMAEEMTMQGAVFYLSPLYFSSASGI
jgi:hypothetical protein